MYRLPDGGRTAQRDTWETSWRHAGDTLGRVLGMRLISFDPGLTFMRRDRSTFYCPQDVVIALLGSLPGGTGLPS